MADIPDFDRIKYIFVGEVAAVAEPKPSHLGKQLQDVTYKDIAPIATMGSKLKVPSIVYHDVTESPLPAIVKVGNTLIVGVTGDREETYVHLPDQATITAIHVALDYFVYKLVIDYLWENHFELSLPLQEGEDGKAFLDGELLSLAAIAEKAWRVVQEKVVDASEGDIGNVRKIVEDHYQFVKEEAEKNKLYQITASVGYAPSIPFWASRSQPPGYLYSWQQGHQYALGWQNRQLGGMHSLALTLALFDPPSAGPIFSNALASYMFTYVRMLGNPISSSGPADAWSYLTAGVFASVGLGIGRDISDDPTSWNNLHAHFMHQEQAGVQVGANIGAWTINFSGAVVYSGNSVFGIPLNSPGFFANQGSTVGAALNATVQYAW